MISQNVETWQGKGLLFFGIFGSVFDNEEGLL